MQQEKDELYERLMTIHQERFAGGFYETAYHTLAAALHHAQDIDAPQLLTTIERVAIEETSLIDTQRLASGPSLQAARLQSMGTLFRSLAKQAAARRAIFTSTQLQQKKQAN